MMSSDDEEVFTEARGDILPTTLGGDLDPDDPPALRTEGNPDPKIE